MPKPRSKPGEEVQMFFAPDWLRCSWQLSVKASMVSLVFPIPREVAVFCNASNDSVSCGQIWRQGLAKGGRVKCFLSWKWVSLSGESV